MTTAGTLETVSENCSHGGVQGVYRHASASTGTQMTFSVFVPPHEDGATLPVLWFLSGLTCTHANVTEKGEYRAACAEHPWAVAGEGRACTTIMAALGPAAFVKFGAEGVYIAALSELGLGLALKVAAGATRAAECAVGHLLARQLSAAGRLDAAGAAALHSVARQTVRTRDGDAVGSVFVAPESDRAV